MADTLEADTSSSQAIIPSSSSYLTEICQEDEKKGKSQITLDEIPPLTSLFQERKFHHHVGELICTSHGGHHRTSAVFHCHGEYPATIEK